ncbi:MAG TPA: MFS transporter, partial [Candidatus Synoicihabitans sp.]|nr:MFS transporter [Candidatus Synoicihabitans sp.]
MSASPLPRRAWIILAMLFVASFLNYFDRQTLSILKPLIKEEYGMSDADYSKLVVLFMAPYIVMYALGGRIVDRIGSRWAMTAFVSIWSAATMLGGWATSLAQFAASRFVLGAAEPGNFPAAMRATKTWFPPDRRGFAVSIFSAGSALGAVAAPPLVALMVHAAGWRSAFWLPGGLGLVWAVVWWCVYRQPRATQAPAEPDAPMAWRSVWMSRALWSVVLARFISDPVWYFYLFWLPGYFQESLGLTLTEAGWIGWIPFLVADIGGIALTSYSDRLIKRGHGPAAARFRILGAIAFLAPLGMLTTFAPHIWMTLAIFSLVGAMCLTWFFSTATLLGDLFPKSVVASALGIAGAFGALGGLLFNAVIGPIIDRTGYTT